MEVVGDGDGEMVGRHAHHDQLGGGDVHCFAVLVQGGERRDTVRVGLRVRVDDEGIVLLAVLAGPGHGLGVVGGAEVQGVGLLHQLVQGLVGVLEHLQRDHLVVEAHDVAVWFSLRGMESKYVTWCFTPSQPLRLYQGETYWGVKKEEKRGKMKEKTYLV